MVTDSRKQISKQNVQALRRFNSCTLSNAIELLNVRPRTEGYIRDPTISCMFPRIPPIAGFAATGRLRSASQPPHGHFYYDHIEWWRYVASIPPPRVVVLLDSDDPPPAGALFGELHARICMALDCVAYISNGAVRDLPIIEELGFQLFAGSVSPSHAYAHVVDYGEEIELGKLKIQPGDLLHADQHGIVSVPLDSVKQLPALAAKVVANEEKFIRTFLNGNFSIERFSAEMRAYSEHEGAKGSLPSAGGKGTDRNHSASGPNHVKNAH